MKKHKWEQDQISHMKEYIARFGHGSAKLARQAQSKEKTLEKMVSLSCLTPACSMTWCKSAILGYMSSLKPCLQPPLHWSELDSACLQLNHV